MLGWLVTIQYTANVKLHRVRDTELIRLLSPLPPPWARRWRLFVHQQPSR
jgi:hypothetical protein